MKLPPVQLLLDEDLSPSLVQRLASQGIPSRAVAYAGLSGMPDHALFRLAFEADEVFVTANSEDFLTLAADVELHPGVIVLREGSLSRDEQFERVVAALAAVGDRADLVNTVVEVRTATDIRIRTIPPT